MYPNLYYALKDLFGVDNKFIQFFRFFNSFGFFVALSFFAAAIVLAKELMRKERMGLLQYREEIIIAGKPASIPELLLNFFLGFLLGFKVIGFITTDSPLSANLQDYVFSGEGSWAGGILVGAILAGLKWWEKNKQKLPEPTERKIRIWPHDRVGDMAIFAGIFGFAGAKVFNSLETWDDFVRNPVESLLSFSGLTFYGGLICAALAIWYYARKKGIPFWHLNDAAAPGLMLAYGIGRIGCQVAGDGDWGILNSAYITGPGSKPVLAAPGDFDRTIHQYKDVYLPQFGSLDQVHHAACKAPSWLPDWFFAYPYPHNVINEGVRIPGCEGSYCSQLPIPVFPTPFYETLACIGLFFFLWAIRKRIQVPGKLFAIYLIVNGVERFFVEKIRVNTKYDIFGFHPTQAEIISSFLVVSGLILLLTLKPKKPVETAAVASNSGNSGNTGSTGSGPVSVT